MNVRRLKRKKLRRLRKPQVSVFPLDLQIVTNNEPKRGTLSDEATESFIKDHEEQFNHIREYPDDYFPGY